MRFLAAGADLQSRSQGFNEGAAMRANQDQSSGAGGVAVEEQLIEEPYLGFFAGNDVKRLQAGEVVTVRKQRAFGYLPLTIG
jgi:hypothetical protein